MTATCRTVAIVPCRNSKTVEATVRSLAATGRLDRIVVVDDGSTDDTAERAQRCGADVVVLPMNRGKGDAVAAGVVAAPDADVFLLVDADLADTAGHTVALLDPVMAGDADLAVAAFPPAGGRGGFGVVKRASHWLVQRACRYDAVEPLSGQRAVRADLMRSMTASARFGLEVGMTIDAVRVGARIVEIPLPLDHDHTGRTLAGFRHRGGQAIDIARAGAGRIGSARHRRVAMGLVTLGVLALAVLPGWGDGPHGSPATARTGRPIIVVTVSNVSLADLERGAMPNVSRLLARSGGALTPRTPAGVGDQISAFATLGAGAPVVLGDARPSSARVGTVRSLSPTEPINIVNDGATARVTSPVRASRRSISFGLSGALGSALRSAGVRTGYVGARIGDPLGDAPGALAIADHHGVIDVSSPGALATDSPADTEASIDDRLAALDRTLAGSSVVEVDSGSSFATWPTSFGRLSTAAKVARDHRRLQQVRVADQFVGRVVAAHPEALVVVAGVAPPSHWRLTPLTTAGDVAGTLGSPSTRQVGLSALTDLAPTVLGAVGLPTPATMIGQRLQTDPGPSDIAAIAQQGTRTADQDGLAGALSSAFVAVQALVYAVALGALYRRQRRGRGAELLLAVAERIALSCASFPMVTFLYRLAPVALQRPVIAAASISLASFLVATLASRARHHPLSPLMWIAGGTVSVMVIDAATSGALQNVSLLGYTPLTAARFYGMGNIGFAVMGATAILLAGAWVAGSPRRSDGVFAAACLLLAVTVVDVAPGLGADFGGALALIPVSLVAIALWAGSRLRLRRWLALGAGSLALLVAVAVVERWSGGTHISHFLDGSTGSMHATISRKIDSNLRVLRGSVWTWSAVTVVSFVVVAMGIGGRWRSALRRWFGSAAPWRITLALLVAFGVLGGLVNDSGIAIPAVVAVYAGAFVLLLLRRRPFAPPMVLCGQSGIEPEHP